MKVRSFPHHARVNLKRLVHKAASLAGLEIRRVRDCTTVIKPQRVPVRVPDSTFENISLVMDCFTGSRSGGLFVQVGANDGTTSDSVNFYVKKEVMDSVLVEPIPSTFSKLEAFYRGVKKVRLVNAAIGPEAGSRVIYSVSNHGRWEDNAWASQLASFDRGHLTRCGIYESEIEEQRVVVMTLNQLLNQTDHNRIAVLQIDVEGFDHEIVRSALNMPRPPVCIAFEYCQLIRILTQTEIDELYNSLVSKGYKWVHDRINTLAVHKDYIPSGSAEQRPS